MNRIAFASLALGLGLSQLAQLAADETKPASTAAPRATSHSVARRTPVAPRTDQLAESQAATTERLIQERAMFRAHERMARTEWRNWAGVSSARPNGTGRPYYQYTHQRPYYDVYSYPDYHRIEPFSPYANGPYSVYNPARNEAIP